MKIEKPYAFRERLLQVHRENLRDDGRKAGDGEFMLCSGDVISICGAGGEIVKTAVCDFIDFLRVSMGIFCRMGQEESAAAVTVALAEHDGVDMKEAAGYKGFMIETDAGGIRVYGHDEKGIAQGLYYLEFLMECERAPLAAFGTIRKKPAFSPRMIHSGYGLDEYPDEYLSRVAHEGRDAILVFVKGVNEIPDGYLNFNDLIRRAARYGLDVYAYSYLVSEMSPESPEAEGYYENTYGRLFRECPRLKGITLVGESVEFPSRDPHVSSGRLNRTAVDGIPTGKYTSGWWPCEDYPIWLGLLKRIVRKYNPEADIVFWTYNWMRRPEEFRIKLIENLPTDISLQVTFEIGESIHYGKTEGYCSDYTLAFEGPSRFFKSEAIAAKKRGIRLYSMTNTGGMTWDFGVVPYLPMPYQWMRRLEAIRRAHEDWGLRGLMESHHYGFTPSFISRLSNYALLEPFEDMHAILEKVLKRSFGAENYPAVDEALQYWSEAIRHSTPGYHDLYGPFRTGPSFPFCLSGDIKIPSDPKAMFGNGITIPSYHNAGYPETAPVCLRLPEEIQSLRVMNEGMEKGILSLESAPKQTEELKRLTNLGRFIYRTVITNIHAKQFHLLKCRLYSSATGREYGERLDEIEALLREEIKNTEATIPLVEQDSRIGWEPSMLYMTDRWHLEWKIRQVNYTLNTDIGYCRTCLTHMMDMDEIT